MSILWRLQRETFKDNWRKKIRKVDWRTTAADDDGNFLPVELIFFFYDVFIAQHVCSFYDASPTLAVWPDAVKFRHFGNISQGFGFCLRIYLALHKMLNLLRQIVCMQLGKFSLL